MYLKILLMLSEVAEKIIRVLPKLTESSKPFIWGGTLLKIVIEIIGTPH